MGGDSAALSGAIRIDEKQLRGHIDEAVRSSVEETLNALLDAETDRICGAGRYERSAGRGRFLGRILRPEAADHIRRELVPEGGCFSRRSIHCVVRVRCNVPITSRANWTVSAVTISWVGRVKRRSASARALGKGP